MADDSSNEQAYLEELRQIKRATLHELDKQAAQYTNANVPVHVQTERQRLRRELGMVESVIASPLNASIGDELGEGNRYIAYIELMRQGDRATLEAVARLEEHVNAGLDRVGSVLRDLAAHLDRSDKASIMWRRWGTIALFIIVIVVIIMALVGVYQLGKLAGDQSFIQDVFAFVWR